MTDHRKALHDQIEQTPEEDVDRLVDFVTRFLHPSESPASQRLAFEPVPPGSKAAGEIEEHRRHLLGLFRARRTNMIARSIGDTANRLGIDLNKITDGPFSWSGSGDKAAEFTCAWYEGLVLNRLGMFDLEEQRVVTFEQFRISETKLELIYKVRVLTSTADIEKQLTIPV